MIIVHDGAAHFDEVCATASLMTEQVRVWTNGVMIYGDVVTLHLTAIGTRDIFSAWNT